MSELTIVIPVRKGGSPETTLSSLAEQTYQDFEVIVSWDQKANANWARNRGAELAKLPLILFSDDDIRWEPTAIQLLVDTLNAHTEASYAFGSYEMDGKVQCCSPFSVEELRRHSCISTMSVIRRQDFPGFDEQLERLQDWDLFLTMLAAGHIGVSCGQQIFSTEKGDGITHGEGGMGWQEAADIVTRKHGLC